MSLPEGMAKINFVLLILAQNESSCDSWPECAPAEVPALAPPQILSYEQRDRNAPPVSINGFFAKRRSWRNHAPFVPNTLQHSRIAW
jgi:hypothetical protein